MRLNEPRRFSVRLRSRTARRELNPLRAPDYRRVLRTLQGLAGQPRPSGCVKLYDDVYRVRVGVWRVACLIDETNNEVSVGSIRRRSERTYRAIEDLFA